MTPTSPGRVRTREQQLPAAIVAVLERAARHFYVTVPEVLGKAQCESVRRARRYAMAALREAPFRRSLPEIGRIFGRCHGTVLAALGTVARELAVGDVVAVEAMEAVRGMESREAAE